MDVSSLLYACGALLEIWIALMLLISWRALRTDGARWPLLIGVAFAVNAGRVVLLANGVGAVPLGGAPGLANILLAVTAIVVLTAGLIDYVGIRPPLANRLNLASAASAASLMVGAAAGWLNRGQALVIAILYFVAWMALFVRAARREPGNGHSIVVGALLTFPICVLAVRVGRLPMALLPVAEIVPIAAIGLTVLTTGLIRAHRFAQLESSLAARALAARELAEARLRAANETLELRVAQRTRELRETIEGLESFNRSVSHDLRGPLGGIAGVAQLARAQVAEGHPAQADHLLAAIARQAEQSIDLVGSLLALARAGDAQPLCETVDVQALVQDTVDALRVNAAAAGRGVAPAIEVRPLPVVQADPALLRQIFTNLIGNACKFTAGVAEPRIEIGCAQRPQGPAFYVRDNGVGFTPAQALRLFKPFERLHGDQYAGFGVGLSIVRRIAEHHGGRSWAEGAPGAGATFWFTLGAGAEATEHTALQ